MRIALAALALLSLSACDAVADDDALVGTWALTAYTETTRITSRTAQSIPDLTQPPAVAVTASGAVDAELDVLADATAGPDGTVILRVSTDASGAPDVVEADLAQIPGAAQATLFEGASARSYSAFLGDVPVLVRDGGTFTVPPFGLIGGDGTVTLVGTVAFPEIALAPGVSTEIRPYDVALGGSLTVTFAADGTFSARAVGNGTLSTTGTWARVGDDRLRLDAQQGGVIEAGTFDLSLAGGVLALSAEDLGREVPCSAECLRQLEGEVQAMPGSLTDAAVVTTLRFRSGG